MVEYSRSLACGLAENRIAAQGSAWNPPPRGHRIIAYLAACRMCSILAAPGSWCGDFCLKGRGKLARATLTGILAGVKDGEYQGRKDVTLTVESGDDNVMVSVPEDMAAGVVTDLMPKVGADVQIPC